MHNIFTKLTLFTLCTLLAGFVTAGEYGEPAAYEDQILAYEAEDAEHKPPAGAIVAIGSSSIRRWNTIIDDLAPLTIIPRGFGGSDANQALYYMDRIVLPYEPRAILYYEGDNDASREIPVPQVLEQMKAFVKRVHAQLPQTRIYFVSVKPSLSRAALWEVMQTTNDLLRAFTETDERLHYIDITQGMLNRDGSIRDDIFVEDQLHLNPLGYELWAAPIRKALMAGEAQYE